MNPYPADVREEAAYLAPLVIGQAPGDLRKAIHCGCVLVDYGAGLIVSGSAVSSDLTAEGVQSYLGLLAISDVNSVAMINIPWDKLIAFLLPLILEWIKKKLEA